MAYVSFFNERAYFQQKLEITVKPCPSTKNVKALYSKEKP